MIQKRIMNCFFIFLDTSLGATKMQLQQSLLGIKMAGSSRFFLSLINGRSQYPPRFEGFTFLHHDIIMLPPPPTLLPQTNISTSPTSQLSAAQQIPLNSITTNFNHTRIRRQARGARMDFSP
ncbi:hypothetical protein FN846DRAFT_977086 [Sphaerosporella brunnea]|uniref:Uncharacterized protein n=1 Tax=Sphaerosporella brunnea TaxID=1250544 RepID=A0A5J5EFG0_9PEZI|nr:hypothetical protein FN846DRAFT_977086 [Sphaerosporella brunnea]